MTDRPILFSPPMIRALLGSRKTMTRRLAWRMPGKSGRLTKRNPAWPSGMWPSPWQKVKPADRLWCREVWGESVGRTLRYKNGVVLYRADHGYTVAGQEVDLMRWRSPIFMPRWASRLTLIVTAVKIGMLHKISIYDAQAEGIDVGPLSASGCLNEFRALWENLHGPESWDANPEVVALTFTVHKANIDTMQEAA